MAQVPPNTSSTPTNSSSSLNGKSKDSFEESDYFLVDEPTQSSITDEAAPAGIDFLFQHFPYAVHTFQFFPSKTTLTFTSQQRDLAIRECVKRNAAGDDVYFMVNEGDGVTKEKTSVRCAAAVHELKWCYIDTDSCPIEKVEAYLNALGLVAHIKVRSSVTATQPPQFHIYFAIEPVGKTPANLTKWVAVQGILARLGDFTLKNSAAKATACDPSMTDHAKLLRVPGFYHVEKASLVTVVDSKEFPAYTLEDLFEITGAQQIIDYCQAETGTNGHSNVPSLTDRISHGGRFTAVQALGMHLGDNQSISKEEKIAIFTKFCRENLDNKDAQFVKPDGSLTPYCLDLLISGIKTKEKELQVEVAALESAAPEQPDDPISQSIASRFDLPETTYENAPNGFGDIVGQVSSNMLYPSAALAFATALSGAALLKSITYRTPLGSACNLYMVAVASTCSGKNDPKTILQNTFVDLEYKTILQNDFRSGAAIGTHLESTGGVGMYIKDEIGYLLSAIQDSKADKNDAAITSKLLEVYTAGRDKQVSFGKLANTGKKGGNKEIRVDYPTIGIMGYTTYTGFSKMFTQASIQSGLFQRFIVVSAGFNLKENPGRDLDFTIKSPFFPKGIVLNPPPELENDESESVDVTTRKLIRLSYTPEAAKRAADVRQHYRKLIHDLESSDPGSLKGAVYGRHAENIERIATVLCGPNNVIDLTTYEWAYTFMNSKQDALLSIVENIAEGGTESRVLFEIEKIKQAIILLCKKTNEPACLISEIFTRVSRTFTTMDQFNKAVSAGVELQIFARVPNFVKQGSNRPGKGISLNTGR
jgi:hypothetical protein